ncbi:lytic transglycosylase domain-containing protein [Burkholderia arboris]|uniref:Lytic transglycosylase domain-containing protein n=1 Tax=Burkholderia arboris TaxID=488730 RepID=A0ABZ3DWV8_9BURK
MLPIDFTSLVQQCAPQVSPITMAAIVRTESGFNPYAIGVVRGRLVRQPASEAEAVATAHALAADGWNFSVGLAQVNRANWAAYGLNERSAFDPCLNLAVGAAVLQGCYMAARYAQVDGRHDPQIALRASLSCYASGNFSNGYRMGYVQRVVGNARLPIPPSPHAAIPAIRPVPVVPDDPAVFSTRTQSRPARHPVLESPDSRFDTNVGEQGSSAVVF